MEIDDRWQSAYGDLEFDKAKFPDAPGMVRQLHAMGFKVTVWVMPFVEENSAAYRCACAMLASLLCARFVTSSTSAHVLQWLIFLLVFAPPELCLCIMQCTGAMFLVEHAAHRSELQGWSTSEKVLH